MIAKIILMVIGVLISLNGLFSTLFTNMNIGVFLCDALGVFLFLSGIHYEKISSYTASGKRKILKIIIISAITAELLFAGGLCIYGILDDVTYNEDAVIVLGAAIRGETVSKPLKMRLDKAVLYHKENPDALIVVTGGKGPQESVTEAYAMEKYLISEGVSPDKIIKEEKATSTAENIRFSKTILDKRIKGKYSVCVITNNFHIYRGVKTAENAGFTDVKRLHADLEIYNILPCSLRETLAVFKMWLLR